MPLPSSRPAAPRSLRIKSARAIAANKIATPNLSRRVRFGATPFECRPPANRPESAKSGRSWDLIETGKPLFARHRPVRISNRSRHPTLGHSISRNILERLVRVAGPLARHLQHAFADDVALDLVRTA